MVEEGILRNSAGRQSAAEHHQRPNQSFQKNRHHHTAGIADHVKAAVGEEADHPVLVGETLNESSLNGAPNRTTTRPPTAVASDQLHGLIRAPQGMDSSHLLRHGGSNHHRAEPWSRDHLEEHHRGAWRSCANAEEQKAADHPGDSQEKSEGTGSTAALVVSDEDGEPTQGGNGDRPCDWEKSH